MGFILSPVQKIDNLKFHPLPTKRPLENVRVVRVLDTIVCVDEKGRVYATAKISGPISYDWGMWPWLDHCLKALVSLGVLTQQEVDDHRSACEEYRRKQDRSSDLVMLQRIGRDHGIKFTQKQLKAMMS